MPTAYNINFGDGMGTNLFLILGPHLQIGAARYFGQFFLDTGETQRDDSVVIPYADGVKDTSDGKRGPGTVTVHGWVYDANTKAAELAAYAIINRFRNKLDFWIWQEYRGAEDWSSGTYHKVRKAVASDVMTIEGWGGQRVEVSITFAVHEYAT